MIVEHQNVPAAFRRLSIPAGVAMLGDQLLGIVDTIAIGTLGAVALAGVTAATTVFAALGIAIAGFLSGLSIMASQRIGAQDVDGYARTVRAGFVVPFLASMLCALLSLFFAGPVLHAMAGNLPTAQVSASYLVLRCISLLPITVSGTLIVGLGAAGNQTLGVIVLAIINFVHIPLLLVLALGWGTHHPFGIVGAGVSSLLSETIACLYALFYAQRRPMYRIFAKLTVDVRTAMRCAWLGLPEAVFLFAVIAPDAFIVAMLAPLGAMVVAGFRALNIVSDLTFVVPSPMQSAAQTVIGQRLGANDVQGARTFFVAARRFSFWVTTAAAALAALLAWPLAYFFTLNAAVATFAALPLALHMATLPLKGWSMVSMSPIRASGDTRFSMLVGILCSALVLPVSFLCIRVLHIGLYGVPVAWITAWSARAVVTAFKLRGEDWTRRTLLAAG